MPDGNKAAQYLVTHSGRYSLYRAISPHVFELYDLGAYAYILKPGNFEVMKRQGPGGEIPEGFLWYIDPAIWMRLLECCDIAYPYPDTLHTFCDSVTFAVDNGVPLYPGYGLPGILEFLQPMFDGYYNGPEEDAPLSFWTGMMDSCGYDCGDYIPCTILDSVLSDFYDTYPQYANSCPPWVLETYLNVHIINSLENGANYANWITLYSCCSQTLPDPDSVMSHCDSMFVAQFYFQHIDSLFTSTLGIPCTPAWAYNLFMGMNYGINFTVGQICDTSMYCGPYCPDTCVLSSFCDSLVSVYTVTSLLFEYIESLGSEVPPIEFIVNIVMGTSEQRFKAHQVQNSIQQTIVFPKNTRLLLGGGVNYCENKMLPSQLGYWAETGNSFTIKSAATISYSVKYLKDNLNMDNIFANTAITATICKGLQTNLRAQVQVLAGVRPILNMNITGSLNYTFQYSFLLKSKKNNGRKGNPALDFSEE